MFGSVVVIFCIFLSQFAVGIDNGLGVTPPMGWRSWNAYHGNINQDLITKCIDAVLDKSRDVNGTPMSLAEFGYNEVGVDDNWQLCDSSGHYFHNDTAPNGWANINTGKFADLTSLVSYAHSNKVGLGWYMNNCICSEHNDYPANEANDVAFLRKYDFDGIKLDGCSTSHNITNWQNLINSSSNKPLLTENCHNSPNYATTDWCPMNFFRSSSDINTNYPSIIGTNLASTLAYQAYPTGYITRPGCFAYPDMLEVGNIPQQMKATVEDMDQTHFSAWCIVSAPLILGFDLTNNKTMDRVWPVITNSETLNVSQNWAGHPGRRIAIANYTITYNDMPQFFDHYGKKQEIQATISGFEVWAKPQPNNEYAVLLMNNDGNNAHDVSVAFTDIPWSGSANIRDLVNRKDLGSFSNSYTAKSLPPFGSAFLLFSK